MTGGRLAGRRVLVTQARARVEPLCFLLEDEGAEVVSVPVLEFEPPDDPRPLRAALEMVHRFTFVALASERAVHALLEVAREVGVLDRLQKISVAAVGPATARAVEAAGLKLELTGELATGAGLAEALRPLLRPADEVLVPAAQEGRPELVRALAEAGIRVTRVAAYKSAPSEVAASVWDALRANPPDVVLFSSPRTAAVFVAAGGAPLVAGARVVAIGPTTQAGLGELGIPVAAVAERPTPVDLVEAAVRAVSG